MRNRLEEVMRQEMELASRNMEELNARLTSLNEQDHTHEQALKVAAEKDHLEHEALLATERVRLIKNYNQRLSEEVLGNPARLDPSEGHPDSRVRMRTQAGERSRDFG